MCVFERDVLVTLRGCELSDVFCRTEDSRWTETETASAFGVVLVRRGCFRRRVGAREEVAHPGIAYFEQPGQEQQFAHPFEGGHQCTFVSLSPDLVDSFWSGPFPTEAVFVDTQVDLRHRRVLAACRSRDVSVCRQTIVDFVHGVLACYKVPVVTAVRPSTIEARRQMVERVREALTADLTLSLTGLCRELTTSPFYLGRIFREQTGETISAFRNRLRVRVALERLSQGADNLARVANELGFSDHAHLTRVVGRDTGMTPTQLRKVLESGEDSVV